MTLGPGWWDQSLNCCSSRSLQCQRSRAIIVVLFKPRSTDRKGPMAKTVLSPEKSYRVWETLLMQVPSKPLDLKSLLEQHLWYLAMDQMHMQSVGTQWIVLSFYVKPCEFIMRNQRKILVSLSLLVLWPLLCVRCTTLQRQLSAMKFSYQILKEWIFRTLNVSLF